MSAYECIYTDANGCRWVQIGVNGPVLLSEGILGLLCREHSAIFCEELQGPRLNEGHTCIHTMADGPRAGRPCEMKRAGGGGYVMT